MFKLSLAFSAISYVAGQASIVPYCDALEAQCYNVHNINSTACQTAMGGVTPGTTDDVNMNTLGCRIKYLINPLYMNETNACRYAGPTGGGRCGAVLPNVCDIATAACNGNAAMAYPDSTTCQAGLSSIQHQWGATQGSNAGGENSLECRMYHAIFSLATPTNGFHCAHYNFSGPCNGPVKTDRDKYCQTLQYNCGNGTSTNAQFALMAQCNATAAGYPNAASDDARNDNSGNNLGCRQYHSQAALADKSHCEHAGPSGAGVCGTRLEAWGSIINAAPCNDPSVKMFISSVGNATANALIPPGNSNTVPYSTTFDTGSNTQVCRIYHLGVASTDTSHCSHGIVSGGGLCGASIVTNLCDFIGGTCGWGTNATWQFPDKATCVSSLTTSATNNITMGTTVPQDTSGNSYECRFYHATVAGSYKNTGSQGSVSGASDLMQFHCSHVLQKAAAGGCGYVAPAPTPKNSASTLSFVGSAFAVVLSVLYL